MKVNQNPDYYRQRQQIIEYLTKGKEKVLDKVYLIFTSYNLR